MVSIYVKALAVAVIAVVAAVVLNSTLHASNQVDSDPVFLGRKIPSDEKNYEVCFMAEFNANLLTHLI